MGILNFYAQWLCRLEEFVCASAGRIISAFSDNDSDMTVEAVDFS